MTLVETFFCSFELEVEIYPLYFVLLFFELNKY